MSTQAEEIESLRKRIAADVAAHKNTAILTARLCSLRARQLNDEIAMQDTITVEMKIHDIEVAVDDLTSLAHSAGGLKALAQSNLEGIERRIRHLRFDIQAQQAAE